MVKDIKDYYEQMYELFPDVPKSDIRKILNFGWKQMYLINSYGGDIVLQGPGFWVLFGWLTHNSIKHYIKYVNKLSVKLRIMYKRLAIPWDNYYYFGLTQKQQDALGLKKTGRKKKRINYGTVMLYKYKEECRLKETAAHYIYRVKVFTSFGFRRLEYNYTTSEAELIEIKETNTLKSILTTNYDYGIGK